MPSFTSLERLSWNRLRIHLVILHFRFLKRASSFALSTYELQFVYRFFRLGIELIVEKPTLLESHKSGDSSRTVGAITLTTLLCSEKALNLGVGLRFDLLNAVFFKILGTGLPITMKQISRTSIFK